MARQQGWFALILALAIAAAAVLASFPLQLGLDLKGGSQLTLQVMPAGSIKTVGQEQLEAVKDVLDRRINGLGVAESTLQTVGDDQLVLQLPGEQDPSRAAKVLGTTAEWLCTGAGSAPSRRKVRAAVARAWAISTRRPLARRLRGGV